MNVVSQFPAARGLDRDARFRSMFEGAAIGIAICQLNGRIVEANPTFSRMLGYSQPELVGVRAGELCPLLSCEITCEIHSAEFSQEERWLGELMRGERASFEVEKRYRCRDGSEFWGDLTMSLARDAQHQAAFLIAWLADASERKRAEEHLREAEKMEIIGRLAGGVAHDFNNLLTGVLLYCDLLSAGLDNDELASFGAERSALRQHVEEVRLAGEQGAALTQQLLAIARKQVVEPRPVSLNEIVAATKNLLQRLIGEPIRLITDLDSGVSPVLADPAQIQQILLNLVLNARDAMPQGGQIQLSTRTAELAGRERTRRAIALEVRDNGCGMDAETRARLFEPFFTTKNVGQGTGLGLATVQRIVSEMEGMIEVESGPGRGSCMTVLFPALESSTLASATQSLKEH